jgi:hypothetical protein
MIAGTLMTDEVPAGNLALVARRAISHDPRWRYVSAGELLSAIETAVAPPGRWETPEERGRRLRQRLAAAIDLEAVKGLMEWASQIGDEDTRDFFALALSAVPAVVVLFAISDRSCCDRTPNSAGSVFASSDRTRPTRTGSR